MLRAAPAMRRLILIRHAETAWNVEGRYQGQTDVPLSVVGRQQAADLHQRLSGGNLFDTEQTAVVSSDLSRAKETARLVFRTHQIHNDPRLRESRYGIFEGLSRDEIKERYPAEFAQWQRHAEGFVIPGSEARAEVQRRALAAIEGWLLVLPHPTVALVTHGGVMRQVLHRVDADLATQVSYHNGVMHVIAINGADWAYGGSL